MSSRRPVSRRQPAAYLPATATSAPRPRAIPHELRRRLTVPRSDGSTTDRWRLGDGLLRRSRSLGDRDVVSDRRDLGDRRLVDDRPASGRSTPGQPSTTSRRAVPVSGQRPAVSRRVLPGQSTGHVSTFGVCSATGQVCAIGVWSTTGHVSGAVSGQRPAMSRRSLCGRPPATSQRAVSGQRAGHVSAIGVWSATGHVSTIGLIDRPPATSRRRADFDRCRVLRLAAPVRRALRPATTTGSTTVASSTAVTSPTTGTVRPAVPRLLPPERAPP